MIWKNCFTIPLLFESLDFNLKAMEKECLKLEKKNKGRTVSSYGGWQSDEFDFDNPIIKPLYDNILKNSVEFTKKFKLKKPFNLVGQNFWVNINRKGHCNILHIHPNSFLSGVFYVHCGNDSGRLRFVNPSNLNLTLPKGDAFEDLNEFNCGDFYVTPQPNLLVMFSSHLQHYVEPNLTDQPRISISFNIGVSYE